MQPSDLTRVIKNSAVVSFHTFVLRHREYGDDLFCFYEGGDAQYYFPRINEVEMRNHPIICGNKRAVLETYEMIAKKYPDYKTMFFVDKDFDDIGAKSRLYVTPCYSIENLYCGESVVSNILKNEFHLKTTDPQFEATMDLFKKMQREFHDHSSLFNIWYYTVRRKARQEKVSPNVSLNDKFPKRFLNIKLGEVERNYDLNDIKKLYPEVIDINEEEIAESSNYFYDIDPIKKHRGKYELEFLIKFLNLLIEDCNKHKTILKSKTKFKIDPAMILSQLSQYAETPHCLREFIRACA